MESDNIIPILDIALYNRSRRQVKLMLLNSPATWDFLTHTFTFSSEAWFSHRYLDSCSQELLSGRNTYIPSKTVPNHQLSSHNLSMALLSALTQDEMTIGIFVTLTLASILFLWRHHTSYGSGIKLPLPPGPRKLPILGNTLVCHEIVWIFHLILIYSMQGYASYWSTHYILPMGWTIWYAIDSLRTSPYLIPHL